MNRHLNFAGQVKRYNHNLSYRNFFSGELGEMRPVWLEDGVPGDTVHYKPEVRLYFSPLVFPVLSSMKARVDVFFVPQRLAWTEWESFLTGGPENNLSPAYPSARNVASSTQAGFSTWFIGQISSASSLLCSLGHPTFEYDGSEVVNDPFDMIPCYDYFRIWDEYYRDEEKEESITAPGGVQMDVYDLFQDVNAYERIGSVLPGNKFLPSIAWAKDYFTTASLEQQRGGDVPLLSNPMFKTLSGSALPGNYGTIGITGDDYAEGSGILLGNNGTQILESCLTINGLRYLYAAANWLNNNVVGGTRYIEQLRRRYKVVSSDARLQRPEMIGSISIPVNIDVVTQTSSTVDTADAVQALGDRAGKASVIGSGKTLTYSCEEFGYFMAILHIAPKAAYFQGIRRNLQREDKFDFYQPEFEFVPQREIRNNEIYADSSHISPEDGGVFGFASQYSEYKHHNDEVHGDFQDTLLAWTMARKFSALPSAAAQSFLRVDHAAEGNNRIFAVPESDFSHIFGVVNNIVLFKREISNREPRF